MEHEDGPRRRKVGLGTLMAIVAILSAIASVAGPAYLRKRRRDRENGVIGALKTLNVAQLIFREGDKDNDGSLDYGNLAELGSSALIDGVLGSGTKYGYVFTVDRSPATPEFLWWGTANPVEVLPGDRYFAINQAGVVHFTTSGPIAVDPTTALIDTRAYPFSR